MPGGRGVSRVGYGMNYVGVLLNKTISVFKEKKRVHLAVLAAELGYRSPEYFRRSIWRLLEAKLGDCIIKVEPWVYEWLCDDGSDGER